MTSRPSVSVSILAYKDIETIGACVESVINLDYPGPVDIRIREQGADDEQLRLIELAAKTSGSRPVTITRGDNVGFAPGHNSNIRASSGEFQLLVNADAQLEPDFLSEAMRHFDDPRVGTIQGKLINPGVNPGGPPVIDTVGFVPSRARVFRPRGQGEVDRGQYDEPAEVFGADGAVPLYRRSALEDVAVPRRFNPAGTDQTGVEWLDETFFIYKCDLDLSWRMQLRGWKTMYVPTAVSNHTRTLSRGKGGSVRTLLAERRKSPKWGRALSFANQRLTMVKNEHGGRLLKDGARFVPVEAANWGVAVFEGMWDAFPRLARLLPVARRKRRFIQERRDPHADPYVWFTD